MFYGFRPKKPIVAFTGTKLHCKSWDAEAALRMLMNNLDSRVALDWKELVVYGGTGRAARNWKAYRDIVRSLASLEKDETLCVQSGKPVYIAKTHDYAPRVVIANSNIVPKWATDENFDRYDEMGLIMYGQMTAGSWIYIGTQGILQGTYETFAECAKKHFKGSLKGKIILTAGMGAMSGAQPLAATLNDAVIIDVEVRRERIEQKIREGYCDRITDDPDEAIRLARDAKERKEPLSIGLVGNAAKTHPYFVSKGFIPDIATDQTSAHNLLSYVPPGDIGELDRLRAKDPESYMRKSLLAIKKHAEALLKMMLRGAIVFDYGNNLRQNAEKAGAKIRSKGVYRYPGFVPAYIRPLFCQGKGPFRWAALSGNPDDIKKIDEMLIDMFPDDKHLAKWIGHSAKKIPLIGIPTRICWLSYGDRAKAGKEINKMVRSELGAPIVIGRDHLDCGSVASPERETEGMKDGSDAIADWPLLNFAMNAISGASWVSFHHGGGVGIGNSLHAGMVIVCDGTKEREKRIKRVLTVDPGIGIARHADAGYAEAVKAARNKGVKIPGITF